METQTPILLWILLLPLAGAIFLALGRNRLSRAVIGRIANLTVGLSFLLSVIVLIRLTGEGSRLVQPLFVWGTGEGFQLPFGLLGDPISAWWAVVVTGVGFLVHLYSVGYMAEDPHPGRYFAELNYFVFAMSLLVLADNFIGMLIGWANVGLASYMLIGFWHERPAASAAAKKAFVMNIVGEVGLILGFAMIFSEFGFLGFDEVFARVGEADAGALTAIGILLLIGVTAKSAQLPLHTWLPDAMQGPTPVSALMHAATMVTAGVYLLARTFPIYTASPAAMQTVAWVGAATALFGAVVATRQFDIKRVLAYSTMSQIGYMVLGVGVGAYTASLFHFFTHAFFKSLLFLGAGLVIHWLHGEQDIRKMGGIGKRQPFIYWTFLAGVLAIAGAPPFAGFFSKDEILGAVLLEGHTFLWLIGVAAAGLTAFYMFRLFALVFAGDPAEEHGDAGHEGGPEMKFPVAILAGLSVVSGLIAVPGVTAWPERFLGPAFALYGHHSPHPGLGWPVLLVLAVAAVGAAAGIRAYGPAGPGRAREQSTLPAPERGWIGNAFYLDLVYQKGVGGLVAGLSIVVASALEPYVFDGAVNGLGAVVVRVARGVRRLHSGYVRRYVLTMVAGLVLFMIYFTLI